MSKKQHKGQLAHSKEMTKIEKLGKIAINIGCSVRNHRGKGVGLHLRADSFTNSEYQPYSYTWWCYIDDIFAMDSLQLITVVVKPGFPLRGISTLCAGERAFQPQDPPKHRIPYYSHHLGAYSYLLYLHEVYHSALILNFLRAFGFMLKYFIFTPFEPLNKVGHCSQDSPLDNLGFITLFGRSSSSAVRVNWTFLSC
ncbi:hypothetical protein FKM82_019860 [Ascaphus truei]